MGDILVYFYFFFNLDLIGYLFKFIMDSFILIGFWISVIKWFIEREYVGWF